MRDNLDTDVAKIEAMLEHSIGGGKGLRALVAHISCDWVGLPRELCNEVAASMEMIHIAALVHDDIIDQAFLRRQRTTAYAEFGADAAVLAGDFLYSRASQILCRANSLRLLQVVADATNHLAVGEVMQLANKGAVQDRQTYLKVIERKTAALFGACAMCGPAIIGDATMEASMGAFGTKLGQAFQIADDCLDYAGDDKKMGKQGGLDFIEGKVTLPLLCGLEDPVAGAELARLFAGERDATTFAKARGILASCGALEQAEETSHTIAAEALAALDALPECDFKLALSQVLDKTISRAS